MMCTCNTYPIKVLYTRHETIKTVERENVGVFSGLNYLRVITDRRDRLQFKSTVIVI